MGMRKVLGVLLCVAVIGTLMLAPAQAHKKFKPGLYECWTTANSTYSNFDLRLKRGGNYVWQRHDGTAKKPGKYVRNGHKLNFTSGYLKNQDYKGLQNWYINFLDQHVHYVYLYKHNYQDKNQKMDCTE